MTHLTPQEVYDLIRAGAADGGWQGFATRIQHAFENKNATISLQTTTECFLGNDAWSADTSL